MGERDANSFQDKVDVVKCTSDADNVGIFDIVQDGNIFWILSLHSLPHKLLADLCACACPVIHEKILKSPEKIFKIS